MERHSSPGRGDGVECAGGRSASAGAVPRSPGRCLGCTTHPHPLYWHRGVRRVRVVVQLINTECGIASFIIGRCDVAAKVLRQFHGHCARVEWQVRDRCNSSLEPQKPPFLGAKPNAPQVPRPHELAVRASDRGSEVYRPWQLVRVVIILIMEGPRVSLRVQDRQVHVALSLDRWPVINYAPSASPEATALLRGVCSMHIRIDSTAPWNN